MMVMLGHSRRHPKEVAMIAEIFMVWAETTARVQRAADPADSSSRFVPFVGGKQFRFKDSVAKPVQGVAEAANGLTNHDARAPV